MYEQSTTGADFSALIEENQACLEQLDQVVGNLTGSMYQAVFGGNGQHVVGKHVRHIIDHYQSFLGALNGPVPALLDYEQRAREEALETDPRVARERLGEIGDALGRLTDLQLKTPLVFQYQTGTESLRATTSMGRDLAFLASHTVHHMAIIGLLVERQGESVAPEFGVHPSTLRYWREQRVAS